MVLSGTSKMDLEQDLEIWEHCNPKDLWIYDKLILSKKLGYTCGPKGVPVPESNYYIIRPITNLLGMGIGSSIRWIERSTKGIPDGFFWCEVFSGRHLTIDYVNKKQVLCVEGLRKEGDPLWKWREWRKIDETHPFPNICNDLLGNYKNINIETIGGNLIEVHLRPNPDWKIDYSSIIPYFEGDDFEIPKGYRFVEDKEYKRIGFYVKM